MHATGAHEPPSICEYSSSSSTLSSILHTHIVPPMTPEGSAADLLGGVRQLPRQSCQANPGMPSGCTTAT